MQAMTMSDHELPHSLKNSRRIIDNFTNIKNILIKHLHFYFQLTRYKKLKIVFNKMENISCEL